MLMYCMIIAASSEAERTLCDINRCPSAESSRPAMMARTISSHSDSESDFGVSASRLSLT